MPYAMHSAPVLAGEIPQVWLDNSDPRILPFFTNLRRLGVFDDKNQSTGNVRICCDICPGDVLTDGTGLHGWYVWRAYWDK